MAEATQITFTHKELVEILLKKQGIHDGIWGLFVRFGMKAMNVGETDTELLPSAIVLIQEFGLQKFEKETSLSVDAARVNPTQQPTKKSGRS